MEKTKKRIEGYDLARAVAIIGMIIVNFKVVFNAYSGSKWLVNFAELFDGKAAATFVVLAGIGLSLMSNRAREERDTGRLKGIRWSLLKRALFLFVAGLLYISIWPADILHYYGMYLLLALPLLTTRSNVLILLASLLVLGYPFLLDIYDYGQGWNWDTLTYTGFWTTAGFLRNLLINGFHPVIPWLSFLLVGMGLGRLDLSDASVRNRAILYSLLGFVVVQGLSSWLVAGLIEENPRVTEEDIIAIFGTKPMPPLPFYMLSGTSIAILVISVCVDIAERWPHALVVRALVYTGQMALTIYILHVVLGMGIIFIFLGEEVFWPISYAMLHAVIFSLVSVVFSYKWRLRYKRGPLEMLMRKLTG